MWFITGCLAVTHDKGLSTQERHMRCPMHRCQVYFDPETLNPINLST